MRARSIHAPNLPGTHDRTLHELQTPDKPRASHTSREADWQSTAILVIWDDSDGWYDHAFTEPTHGSFDPQADQLNGPGKCGTAALAIGVSGKPVNGRCGPGTRIPFLVISPWTRANHVDHAAISLTSAVRFIEDN